MKKNEINYLLKAAESYERRAKKLEKEAAAVNPATGAAVGGAVGGPVGAGIGATIGAVISVIFIIQAAGSFATSAKEYVNKSTGLDMACNKILENIKNIGPEGLNHPVIKSFIEKIKEILAQKEVIASQVDISLPDASKIKTMSEEDQKSLAIKAYDALMLKRKQISEFKDKISSINATAVLKIISDTQGYFNQFQDFAGILGTSTKKYVEEGISSLTEYSEVLASEISVNLDKIEQEIKKIAPKIEEFKNSESDDTDVTSAPSTSTAVPAAEETNLEFFGREEEDTTDEEGEDTDTAVSNLADLAGLNF